MRWAVARHYCVTAHIVDLGRCDGCGRRIAFVAGFKEQKAFDVELVHVLLDSSYSVLSHAVEIDTLLVIDLHHSMGTFSHDMYSC
jgi:hypothetical protein